MSEKNYYKLKGLVSNSSLNALEVSQKLFKKYLEGIVDEDPKDYLRFGQLVHLKVLEPMEFTKDVLVYDYETPKSAQQKGFIEDVAALGTDELNGEKITDIQLVTCYTNNYSTKESEEKILEKANKLMSTFNKYLKYLKVKDIKTVISSREVEKIEAIEANLRTHKAANELLFSTNPAFDNGKDYAFNEFEMHWEYDGVKCKSLADRIVIDTEKKIIKLVDYKTTAKLYKFNESFYSYNYDRQLVFYRMAIKASFDKLEKLIGRDDVDLKEFDFEMYIVASDTLDYDSRVFKIEEEDLEEALIKIPELLTRAKWHIQNDEWNFHMEYYSNDGYESLKK
jgi:hypothetical protein